MTPPPHDNLSETAVPAPPARPLPEGVQCIACGYSLCGLTVERDCPECGLLAGNSVITDPKELSALDWLRVRVAEWQALSALVAGMIVLIPTIIGSVVCMFAYLIIYFKIIREIVRAPPMLRELSSRFTRRSDGFPKMLRAVFITCLALACGASIFHSELFFVGLLYAVYVSLLITILGMGNALQAANDVLARSRGVGQLSRWDYLFASALLLASLTAALPLMFNREKAWQFQIVVVAVVCIMAVVSGAFHAIALQKPRKQLARLVANSNEYLAAC